MEGFLIQGRDLILTGWRWLHEPQVGVSTPWGALSTGGVTLSSAVCWSRIGMEALLIRGWDITIPGWR